MKRAIQIGAVLLLATLAAQAGETRTYREGNAWVQEITGAMAPMKNVKVSTPAGAVKVQGSPQQQNITYKVRKKVYRVSSEAEAQRLFEAMKVTAWAQGDLATFGARFTTWQRHSHASLDFEITVPRGTARVDADTNGGPIEVRGIVGTVDARTAGGPITLDDVGGQSAAFTSGGPIHVARMGSDVKLKTQGGPIVAQDVAGTFYAYTAGGPVKLNSATTAQIQTMGGSIEVNQCEGDLTAVTMGGNIDVVKARAITVKSSGGSIQVGSAQGPVKAATAGGGLRLMGLRHGVIAHTAAGGITVEFLPGIQVFTDSSLATTTGDIVVYLPDDLGVTLSATVEMGNQYEIKAPGFSGLQISKPGREFGPRPMTAEGAINGGGPLLKLHTANGNIELRKTKKGQR